MSRGGAGANARLLFSCVFLKIGIISLREQRENRTMPKTDIDTRAILVLQTESRRMREAAERVDLVVRAMALRRGIRTEPYTSEDANGSVSAIV
jgi:hypothetical protein